MTDLLVKPRGDTGRVTHVTPASAGWTYVGFDLFRLKAGDEVSDLRSDRETCLVLIAG
ncbi:MAG: 5-deoxy-glucuronate isomerase, partial [Rhizobiaceae bacterium]|nr:5-deoxy-glucuronate isomerase [Rhizobiaceae bacterium]